MPSDPRDRIDLPRLGHRPDQEMDQEIDAHLQLRIDDLVRGGLSLEDARREAESRFGDLRAARRALHTAARRREASLRSRDRFTALAGDVKFGLRQIRRSAGHSALVILTLALGIGLTTAMFTLVERVLFNPLPFPHAEQLVALHGRDSIGTAVSSVSDDDWLDWQAAQRTLAGMAAYQGPFRNTIVTGDSAVRFATVHVSPDFFALLQSRFLVGRPFTSDETIRSGVVVVSERVWRAFMGGDPTLRTLPWGAQTLQVVGVVAAGAEYPAGTDMWIPYGPTPGPGGATRNNINWSAFGRLKPGASAPQATADLNRIGSEIRARDQGGFYDFGGSAVPLLSDVVDNSVASSLRLLMECVLVVLLLVCANLTIATLGRGAVRERELAIRTSLGATRSRLVTQLLVEHVLLAGAGGLLGLALAWATVKLLVSVWAGSIPRAAEVHIDLRVVGFAAGISLLVGILAGIIPALRGSRVSLQGAMKQGGLGVLGGKQRAAGVLVVAEFALALMLLTGAGLLIHSFQVLIGRDLGFSRNLSTVELVLAGPRYGRDPVVRMAAWDRLLAAYRGIPGVEHAGLANQVPLGSGFSGFVDLPGREGTKIAAGYRMVSEDYFRALGVRVLAGRTFSVEDSRGAVRGVVINQAMARAYWPDRDPIGQQVRARSMEAGPQGEPADWLTVIGVVSDVRHFGPESDVAPEMFVFFRQGPQWRTTSMSAVVSSRQSPAQMLPLLRSKTREFDAQLAPEFGTMETALDGILAGRRLTMTLLAGFAALALILAALGIYAVLSYAVTRRTREIAMRSALGAQRRNLLAMMLRSGLTTVLVGMTIGLAASAVLARLIRTMLVGVSALDPTAFVAAALVLGGTALAAIAVPAIRATRLDPMIVLRRE